MLAPTSPVDAGSIYKTVDANGNVIFTDQPLEGAKSLSNDNAQPSNPRNREYDGEAPVDENAPKAEGVLVAPQPKNPPKSEYQEIEEPTDLLPVSRIEIITPVHDTTLQNPVGLIWVELQSYPTPIKKTGLTAQLWMDDKLVNSGQRPMLSLPTPNRGTHVLRVKLVDDQGRAFLQSDPTHIHVSF